VFHFTKGTLSSIELATGAERVLISRDFGSALANMRLSHDGRSLVVTTLSYIGVYDIATGALRDIAKRTEPIGDSSTVADWSADGGRIMAIFRTIAQNAPRELRVYPAAGGPPQKYALGGVFGGLATSPDGIHAAVVKSEIHRQVWVLENFLPAR
jgi:hypothetical protein